MTTPTSFQLGTAGERYVRMDRWGNAEVVNLSPGTTGFRVNDLVIANNDTNTAVATDPNSIALGGSTLTLGTDGIVIGYGSAMVDSDLTDDTATKFAHSLIVGSNAAIYSDGSDASLHLALRLRHFCFGHWQYCSRCGRQRLLGLGCFCQYQHYWR